MSRDALLQSLRGLPSSMRRPLATAQLSRLDRVFADALPPVLRDYLGVAGAVRGPAPLFDLTEVSADEVSPFAFVFGTWLRDAGQILDLHAELVAKGGPRDLVPVAEAGKGKLLCVRRAGWDAEVLAWDEDIGAAFIVAPSFARWVRRAVIKA